MAQCECLATCPFFADRMENMPTMAGIYKEKYCLGSSEECARYRVFKVLGKGMVPANLFPNDGAAADAVLAG